MCLSAQAEAAMYVHNNTSNTHGGGILSNGYMIIGSHRFMEIGDRMILVGDKTLSGGGPVIDLLHMVDLALHFMGYPEPKYVMGATFRDFINDKRFKGPWGIPDKVGGVCDVEAAAHGFVSFKNGSVLFLRTSWAEMNKREEVSVTFQGTKAGGAVRRLFGRDGIDSTAEDTCEMYLQDAAGGRADKTLKVEKDEMMGRVRAAENFINVVLKKEKPFNSPDEAVKLMKIVDAIYASAKSGAPVRIK